MIINCPPLDGIDKDCINNIGGIKTTMYLFPSSKRTELVYDGTDYVVEEVTYAEGSTAVLPVTISFDKKTANWTESLANTVETTNTANTVTISITINSKQYSKQKSINLMASGNREIDFYISNNNGTNWFIPEATLVTSESNSGTLRADGSNYVLTFTAELDHAVYGVTDVNLAALITTGKIEAI